MVNNRAGNTSQRCGHFPAVIFSDRPVNQLNDYIQPKTARQLCKKAHAIGFVDADTPQALYFFERIGYQRASEYFDLFFINDKLDSGASIRAINEAIVFDRKMQSIFLEYIGIFELQLRTRLSYSLSLECGAFSHLDEKYFKNKKYYDDFLGTYHAEVARRLHARYSPIVSAYNKYQEIPVWVAVEVLSLGTISRLFANLKVKQVRHDVADFFGIKSNVLDSWLRAISQLRNCCAHFSRVCGKDLISTPLRIPCFQKANNRRPFYMVLILEKLLASRSIFTDDLSLVYAQNLAKDSMDLIYNNMQIARLFGLPNNWEDLILNKDILGMECHIFHNENIDAMPTKGIRCNTNMVVSNGFNAGRL
ncbi:Abi family protein [Fannyhessea vaginae]|uniref:Abi family protein n=1 Tax=Fannyhessea vaginae TaxID=82135 RepID=UPI00336A7806